MATFKHQVGARVVSGAYPAIDFGVSSVATTRATGGATSTVKLNDLYVDRTVGAGVITEFDVGIVDSLPFPGHVVENLTPSIASFSDSTMRVTRLMDGVSVLKVTTPVGVKYVTAPVSQTIGTSDVLNHYYPGSVAANISSNIAALIAGKTPQPYAPGDTAPNTAATTQDPWLAGVNFNQGSFAAVPNPHLFCAALDFSFLSFWNSFANDHSPVTLVSPLHVLICKHWAGTGGGWTVVFREPGGTFQSRTVVALVDLGSAPSDTVVGLLNAPINTIAPAVLLPSTFASYMPDSNVVANGYPNRLPALFSGGWDNFGQMKKQIRLVDFTVLSHLSGNGADFTVSSALISGPRAGWGWQIKGGDSGSVSMFPITIGGVVTPVVIGSQFTVFGGPLYPGAPVQIQAAMNSLAAGYNLTYADLSAYPVTFP